MTININPLTNYGKNITRGMHPARAISLQLPLDFSADTTYVAQLPISAGIKNNLGIDFVQSVQIDNTNNAAVTSIFFDNGYELICPPFAIGIFPVFVGVDTGLNFKAVSTGGVLVNTFWLNTREQPAIWSTKFPLAGTINVTGSVITSSPTPGLYTDRSAALAVGGTAQQIMAANGNRLGFSIKNPGTAAMQNIGGLVEPAYISWGGGLGVAAQGSWELLPGESVTAAGLGICSTQSIFFNATTAGHVITAKET